MLSGLPVQAAGNKIDRVEIGGVTAFSQSDIEATLEISPGDAVDRGKILRTAENLTNLYHNRGFQAAVVDERLSERSEKGKRELILEYEVREGKPTRISDVDLRLVQESDPVLHGYFEKLVPTLRSKMGLNPSDILD